MKRLVSLSLLLFVLFVAACGNDLASPGARAGITLLVTNSTCANGHCDSLRVLGFPSNQPNTPGGFWEVNIGLITTAQACVTFPPSAHFYVIRYPPKSSADTTTFAWTTGMPLSLGAYS